nr:hypothetical protein [uncultured Allomuricauda sp.]
MKKPMFTSAKEKAAKNIIITNIAADFPVAPPKFTRSLYQRPKKWAVPFAGGKIDP